MNRRRFLAAAASSASALLAGCFRVGGSYGTATDTPPTASEQTATPTATGTGTADTATSTADGPEWTRVDVSPGDEVSGIVDDIGAGDRLEFPSGRFRWTSTTLVTADDWGIRCQDDTVFEVPAGTGDGEQAKLIATHDDDVGTADDVHLENLTFDAPGRAAPGLRLGVRNRGRLDGLHYRMNGPLSVRPQDNGLHAFVRNSEGLLRVNGYRQFNNGDLGAYSGGESRVGVWVGPRNRGTVHLRNPVLQGFPNNACYVSRQPGRVVVDGGLLMNNNVSAVRVSGGVEVRDTTVLIDLDRYLDGPGVLSAPDHNTRGVWGDNRQAGTDGGIVRNVSFLLRSYRRSTGLATILRNPKMTLRECQFLLDADLTAVRADDGEIVVDDCHFFATAPGSTAGLGDITGSGGHIAPYVAPGDVPVRSFEPAFDWSLTHPKTPGDPPQIGPCYRNPLNCSNLDN